MRRAPPWRLLLPWLGAVAAVVLGGGAALYAALERSYRADFDHEVEETAELAVTLYRVDRGEWATGPETVAHVMSELTTPDRTLAAYDARGRRIAVTRSAAGAPDLSHVDPFAVPLAPASRTITGHEVRLVRTPLPDSLWLVVGVSDGTYLDRIRTLRLLLASGLPLLLALGGGLGVLVMRPIVAAERRVADDQRRFLADAAHELRTPVAVLQRELEAARGPDGTRPGVAALDGIARETARLARLVDDLLLLARTDALPPPERQPLFLDDVAHRALGRARRLPAAAGRTITLGRFEAAPARGDAVLLERAVVVLLENALVHGGPGPVTLEAGRDGGTSVVAVRDTGPGIAPADRERIFTRRHRGDASRPGTGLGLPIARWIATLHDGTVRVEDADPGARFVIRLPATEHRE